MTPHSVNALSERKGSGRSVSHQTPDPQNVDTALIDAIAEIGRVVDQLKINVDRQLRELREDVSQWEDHHRTDLEHWGEVTEHLVQLLKARAEEAQEVSNSYVQLVGYLTKVGT